MTTDLAQILREQIEDLPFVERIAGLVRTQIMTEETDLGKKRKSFPVACDVSAEDCVKKGKYQDLVPNDKVKSVIYFEENGGSQFLEFVRGDYKYRSSLRLVGWLNLKKLGVTGCSYSANAVMQILSALPMKPFNALSKYTRVEITGVSEMEKSNAIFAKYTYDEGVSQYLMYPFDFFALNITLEYIVPRACISEMILNDPLNCPTV